MRPHCLKASPVCSHVKANQDDQYRIVGTEFSAQDHQLNYGSSKLAGEQIQNFTVVINGDNMGITSFCTCLQVVLRVQLILSVFSHRVTWCGFCMGL